MMAERPVLHDITEKHKKAHCYVDIFLTDLVL